MEIENQHFATIHNKQATIILNNKCVGFKRSKCSRFCLCLGPNRDFCCLFLGSYSDRNPCRLWHSFIVVFVAFVMVLTVVVILVVVFVPSVMVLIVVMMFVAVHDIAAIMIPLLVVHILCSLLSLSWSLLHLS